MDASHPDRASPNFVGVCIATGVLTLLSAICVALRFVSQHRKRELWWDDWTIVAALVFTIGLFVNTILVTMPSLGASGYHIETYTVMQLNTWSKVRDIDTCQEVQSMSFGADKSTNKYFLLALPLW